MAIYVVDGKPRHGKTAWLIAHLPQWLKDARDNNWKIYSNVKLNLGEIKWIRKAYKNPDDAIGDLYKKKDRENPKKLVYYWRNIDEWNLMRHGTIICDEATRYFNARRWQMLSSDTEIALQQHGKSDLDCWLTTQHYSRLDATLRVLCESFFRVERVWGWGNTTWLTKISEHYLEDLERYERNPETYRRVAEGKEDEGGEEIQHEYLWIGKKIKRLYDTKQQVLASRPMPLKHEERFCPDPKCKLHKKPKVVHS